MTKKELYSMDFDTAIEKLQEENQDITDYGMLKDFAIENIETDNLYLAIHILTALNNTFDTYYNYDYSMGTSDTPTPLKTLEDLEIYCKNKKGEFMEKKNRITKQQEKELQNHIMEKLFTFGIKSIDDGIYNKLHKKGDL